MTEESAEITQLQQQQSLFTQALKAMLEGRWVGENSVEAFLYALDPNMVDTIDYDIPITESSENEEPSGKQFGMPVCIWLPNKEVGHVPYAVLIGH